MLLTAGFERLSLNLVEKCWESYLALGGWVYLQATVLLAPKLSPATLNGQLLKYLAKCQLDEKPNIRVLTNICLGRIAGHFNPAVSVGGE